MNKKGLGVLGIIFILILVVIIGIVGFVGLTAYQGYSVVKSVQIEMPLLEQNVKEMGSGDCSKIPEIEESINKIKKEADDACSNPLISYGLTKIKEIPIKCDNIEELYSTFSVEFDKLKKACEDGKIEPTELKALNLSEQDLQEYSEMF